MADSQNDLQVTYAGPVCTITISRPEHGNRWRGETSQELAALVKTLRHRDDIHVVILTGAGDVDFCLGSFNPQIRAAMPKEQIVDFVIKANMLFDSFEALPQIVIAAINGHARGSGVEIALACDMRIVAERATVAFPEADMGGFPGGGGPVRLPEVVGHGRALEMLCTGRVVPAEELIQIGFAQAIGRSADFTADVQAFVGQLTGKGPIALRGAKQIVTARLRPGFHEARALSDRLRRELEWSHDVDEALTAYKEGRSPVFRGI